MIAVYYIGIIVSLILGICVLKIEKSQNHNTENAFQVITMFALASWIGAVLWIIWLIILNNSNKK